MGGDTTIYSNLNPVLYHGLDRLILHFSVLLILEEASLKVIWKTAPSLSITHANVLCLAKAVADRTKLLSRFWIDSAPLSPVCSLLFELSTKGHSESIRA